MKNPLEIEIKKTVFAHLPAVGDFGVIDRADSVQKRMDQELEILRKELKSAQIELDYAKAN
jgi:hypothetical protein